MGTFAVAGATGRVGSATARSLLAAGANVRVLVRRQSDGDAWRARGAEARVVDLEDRAGLGSALEGCSGFFVLLPFDLTVDDLDAHAGTLIDSIAGAVADRRVPHVVMLSSGGADLAEGTGPITGLHRLEQALLATGTTLTALRPGHFQEKVTDLIDVARERGIYPVFAASADAPRPMVATRDLGHLAADALLAPPTVSEAVDVIGPAYSERAVAVALGDALGRQLQVATLPDEAWAGALADAGMREHIATSVAELYRADEQGLLAPRGDRSVRVHTSVGGTLDRLLDAAASDERNKEY
ncbi:NAD-dependent epimerase/dehydratase family protein [Occultella glacieicola]|uniref:NAD-dependent epimerase/dehydratase family protein n=1 Tax=Occultella glacieicola TaxID=2518684 RepID=A0ABY2DZI3_9MICO|nr:NAD(P)H-binding protein [Occultella glacieicola]TDE89498.1 NAD-dependent epimerase/dehydratase family protein [Occultella glacieicola]